MKHSEKGIDKLDSRDQAKHLVESLQDLLASHFKTLSQNFEQQVALERNAYYIKQYPWFFRHTPFIYLCKIKANSSNFPKHIDFSQRFHFSDGLENCEMRSLNNQELHSFELSQCQIKDHNLFLDFQASHTCDLPQTLCLNLINSNINPSYIIWLYQLLSAKDFCYVSTNNHNAIKVKHEKSALASLNSFENLRLRLNHPEKMQELNIPIPFKQIQTNQFTICFELEPNEAKLIDVEIVQTLIHTNIFKLGALSPNNSTSLSIGIDKSKYPIHFEDNRVQLQSLLEIYDEDYNAINDRYYSLHTSDYKSFSLSLAHGYIEDVLDNIIEPQQRWILSTLCCYSYQFKKQRLSHMQVNLQHYHISTMKIEYISHIPFEFADLNKVELLDTLRKNHQQLNYGDIKNICRTLKLTNCHDYFINYISQLDQLNPKNTWQAFKTYDTKDIQQSLNQYFSRHLQRFIKLNQVIKI
ncbi:MULTISPECIES: type VI secretion system baseplate subunit TssF/IglH [Cysteiniphilum]|uniref:type VI secretion system baseplate subunit TssF/IglH n=1 Tax=Cysteiniphilum TaxID=2056696 RepID=UPI001780D3D7|nr:MULTISPECIES: type VI secretion system baseplate subunit TssF/IglH [Cysteiniphilum]